MTASLWPLSVLRRNSLTVAALALVCSDGEGSDRRVEAASIVLHHSASFAASIHDIRSKMKKTPRNNSLVAAGALAATLAVTAPAAAFQPAGATEARQKGSDAVVLDQGEFEVAVRLLDNRMQVQIKDSTLVGRQVWREPSEVVFHVRPQAKQEVPNSDQFTFLGEAGAPVWLLDQTQQEGLLWPGWSTEELGTDSLKGDVSVKLAKVKGPGNFAVFTFDGMSGANVRFNSGDGLPDTFTILQGTHAHDGWAFTKEGVYRITLETSGTLPSGKKVKDTETLSFAVGDVDPMRSAR